MTATERLMGATPAWAADPAPEVIMRHRSGSVSSRRAYPVARNDPPPNRNPSLLKTELIGVGSGNDVYLEPDSDEPKHRIKRIKNAGTGANVLVDQGDGDLENRLRSVKEKSGTLLTVEQTGEEVLVGSDGATGSVEINIGGRISTVKGIVDSIFEGERGGDGSFGYTRCGGSRTVLFSWTKGQILESGDITVDVGDCGSTITPGP